MESIGRKKFFFEKKNQKTFIRFRPQALTQAWSKLTKFFCFFLFTKRSTFFPFASFYTGRVTHKRHDAISHKLNYAIWMLSVDLDHIDELAAHSWLFCHNRFGVLSLRDRDHGFRDGTALRPYVEGALAAQGMAAFGHRVAFMTIPRLLGYAFPPISFYFCYDGAGELGAVLHQVKSTFGDQIGYLMPMAAHREQTHPKQMHVSPFFDMGGGYRFALTPPGETFRISITYGTEDTPRLTATMKLARRPWNAASLREILLKMPLIPVTIMLAIHWNALKLFLKGAKFHSMPKTKHATIATGDAP